MIASTFIRRPRSVALYSGGVDSYCMAYLLRPDVLLHVNMGGRYGDLETAGMRTPAAVAHRLITVDAPVIGTFEHRDSKYIPGRNAMLSLLAANYGDNILMGSVAASTGNDKDQPFCDRMARLFDHMFAPQRTHPDGRTVRIHLPLVRLTKAQVVGEAIAAGHDPDELAANTFSCYEPQRNADPCGTCPPCGRKWAAFRVWGVDVGFDGREAFRPYWNELITGDTAHRTIQFRRDVSDAWFGIDRTATQPTSKENPCR